VSVRKNSSTAGSHGSSRPASAQGTPRPDDVEEKFDPAARAARDRLDRDQHRLDELAVAGFVGVAYDRFRDDLWIYAMPVLKSGIRSGRIFTWCRDQGVAINPTADERRVLHASIADRDELALETIAQALDYFRTEVLLKKRWSAAGGAGISTFFIGSCKFQFRTVYRRWSRERADRLAPLGYGHTDEEIANELTTGLADDPERSAITRDTLARVAAKSSPEARMIFSLILKDLTYAEIAQELGISSRAVEGHMHRLRLKVWRMAERGEIEIPASLAVARQSVRTAA
jgi:RNA polymerase sigma factor (sigma-70 family)